MELVHLQHNEINNMQYLHEEQHLSSLHNSTFPLASFFPTALSKYQCHSNLSSELRLFIKHLSGSAELFSLCIKCTLFLWEVRMTC